jgi:myo-inositol catabolism protein IolH
VIRLALDPAMLKGLPVEASFRSAANAGYRFVELGNRDDVIGAFGAVSASSRDLTRIRRAAGGSGVEIVSVAVIQAWSSPDDRLREQAVAWWRDGIAAANELHCDRINTELSGDPARPAASRDALLRSIGDLLPDLERAGVEVVVEPHPGDFIETTAEAVDLIQALGNVPIRYLHCLPHAYYLGGSEAEQIERARGWFDHAHVADTYRPGRTIVNPPGPANRIHQHSDIGVGELDWAAIGGALRSVGFDGILTVQVFGWEERAERSFRQNRAALTRLIEDFERHADESEGR